jgi:hypothetical protein
MLRGAHRDKKLAMASVGMLSTLTLCVMQFGDRNGLNSMSFAQVQQLGSNLTKAQRLAKQGNIEFLGGQVLSGRSLILHGELTDANCYFGEHSHGYDHAFCAKVCVANGSPLLFVSDQQSEVYLVLTATNGVQLHADVLNQIGVPGVVIKGKLIENGDQRVLAVEELEH